MTNTLNVKNFLFVLCHKKSHTKKGAKTCMDQTNQSKNILELIGLYSNEILKNDAKQIPVRQYLNE